MKTVLKSNFLSSTSVKHFCEQRILVTGCSGQIGNILANKLNKRFGPDKIVYSDKRTPKFDIEGTFIPIDVTEPLLMEKIIETKNITKVYHLAAFLSKLAEQEPDKTVDINISATYELFKLAIGVYGRDAEKENTDETAPTTPTGIYGVSKVFQEKLSNYFAIKNKIDVRVARLSACAGPFEYQGNNTFSYTTEVFFNSLKNRHSSIPIGPERVIPFAYLDDLTEGMIQLMEADRSKLTSRVYNLSSFSLRTGDLLKAIRERNPNFSYSYNLDSSDGFAKDWPNSLNTAEATRDFGWNPKVKDLDSFVDTMFKEISQKI